MLWTPADSAVRLTGRTLTDSFGCGPQLCSGTAAPLPAGRSGVCSGVATDFEGGGTNRRQMAKLTHNIGQTEQAPDLGHFILEPGGNVPC